MEIPISCVWYAGDAAPSGLLAHETVALIVLAVTLVVYRTFRERYLLVWIMGWIVHVASSWQFLDSALLSLPSLATALSQAGRALAVTLFCGAILVYLKNRSMMRPLFVVSSTLVAYALIAGLCWPGSILLRLVLELSCRTLAVAAALFLIRCRWGRAEVGPWLLGLGLLLLRLDWKPVSSHIPFGVNMAVDLLLGTSMLLIVLDDSRMRTLRLSVIQTLTVSITRAQHPEPMMEVALRELKTLMGAKAAWFRMVEGDKMVMAQQIGLSPDFLRQRPEVPKNDNFERTFESGLPMAVKISSTDAAARPYLQKEGFDHCVFVPVLGKTSVIGTLTLGSERHMRYTAEEMSFFSTTAHQLGLAVENLRLMEQVLRSHRQWTNTFDSLQDSVLVHDADFRIMKANMSLLRRLGRAPADVIGKTCQVSLPGDSGWAGCPYCLDGEGFYESRDACFGGFSAVSTSSYLEEGGKQKGTIHIVHDVTDRHLAAQKYRLLFQQMQEGVFVATPAGQLMDCNEAFVRMLGYQSREEVMVLNLETEMYASSERRADFRRQVESQNYVRNFEVQLRRKDGSLLTAMESSFATRNDSGEIERYQGFLLDISEKKQVEDEIRRRNRELNALNAMAMIASQSFDMDEILNVTLRQMILLLEAHAGSIYVADSEKGAFRRRANWGHATAENGRPSEVHFEDGFGELVTRSRTEVLTPDYLPHLPPKLAQFISGADSGSWIWVLLWGKDHPLGMLGIRRNRDGRYTSNDENLLVATGRQLATTIEKICLYEETCRAYQDLRHAQEQLLQSEKMSAMGQLIAGVAHELNNPLTAILGYAQLLESEQLTERSADFVAKLFRQAQRTHRVVQNLLSFARQRTPQKHQVDVLKVLEETLALREYDLRVSGIQLEREIEAGIPAVTADPHQLEQVFLNIINNAMDAMHESGKSGKLRVSLHSVNGKVCLQFHDSGSGIKEPKRIFDPFYTTKSVGKGTGLGLSICYGIIKEHGGDISARNSELGGAIIEIRLPSGGGTAVPDQPSTPAHREMVLEGRILLVEDEEAVLEFARDVLTGAGAQVVTSTQREQTQSLLLTESFHTLVVNGKMLGAWDAAEIYGWLKENRPNLTKHLLFTFSTMPEPELREFLNENQLPYLVKPFEVSELISQVRRLLEKTQSAVAG
jgi:PAS domain S-box-containing protein